VVGFTFAALVYRVHTFTEDTVHIERNYYGVLRREGEPVARRRPETRYRSLVHGAILHGEQYLSEKYRRSATTTTRRTRASAARSSPSRAADQGRRDRPGRGLDRRLRDADDTYRFYDINPACRAIANTWFTYLKDSPGKMETVLGDARLSLEREAPQNFDVLAVDAFSGDSIPVHLITVEAFTEYLRHLKPEGVIAFHVSNRFLDLKPVLLAIAEKHGSSTPTCTRPARAAAPPATGC
jgi:hypothetical protein